MSGRSAIGVSALHPAHAVGFVESGSSNESHLAQVRNLHSMRNLLHTTRRCSDPESSHGSVALRLDGRSDWGRRGATRPQE